MQTRHVAFSCSVRHSIVAAIVVSLFIWCLPLSAMPPSPELLQTLKQTGRLQEWVEKEAAARAKGVNAPEPRDIDPKGLRSHALQIDAAAVDTFRALLIMVDFSDNPASGGSVFAQAIDFQNLIFSNIEGDGHYSAAEFYVENSYGGFIMEGDVAGWYRMPQTYAYYVDGDGGFGSYPQNAQRLALDALLAADPDVDYSDYDNDGDGWLDGVFIVHAGPGREATGSDDMIHSHKWSLISTINLDGTNISPYTMEPEEAGVGGGLVTMGVFAHEYGHFLGLPDLYDTDYSSEGIGRWSLMSGGSWNNAGRYPAFMDAWCKKEVGFLTLTNITSNVADVEVPASIYSPVAYRLWADGAMGPEYFIIENRQRIGHDYYLPGAGLLILHVDEMRSNNNDETHLLVAVEQADGMWHMENNLNDGDAGDVWSATTKTDFDDLSVPDTRDYYSSQTKTAVWGISASDSVMTAGFEINYSRPRFDLLNGTFSDADYGNDNGVVEVGETITFTFSLQNLWLGATNVTGAMTSDNNDIQFTTETANIGAVTGEGGTGDNSSIPIIFDVPSSFEPCIDSFFLEISSDNPYGGKVFGFELNVGAPEILVVDDDNGDDYEQALTSRLFDRRSPFHIWSKADSGSPSASVLNDHQLVMWTIGDARADIISAADIAAMKSFMDNGGNLFLTGQSIIGEIDIDDQTFLNDYLRASYESTLLYPFMTGLTGSPLGDGIQIRYGSQTNQSEPQTMTAINGSVANFELKIVGGVTALTYEGTYRLVLFGFGFEAISDLFVYSGYAHPDTVFERIMDFLHPTEESLNPTIMTMNVPGETSTNVLSHVPTFEWSVMDTTANPIIEYQVKVGTGDRCHNSDDMWEPGVFSGSAVSIVYGGAALVDATDYVFQVRVNNGESWSAWTALPFHTNGEPDVGLIGGPKDDQQVTTVTPALVMSIGSDPDDDVLTYEFEVYSDEGLTSLVASADGVPYATPVTWTVDVALGEDQHYFWRGRSFDGFEHSSYTEVVSFYVNAANQPPNTFNLISPGNGSFAFSIHPRLTWHRATDNDPGDSATYTLWTSDDPAFSYYVETAGLADTFRTLTYALVMGETYYWKVMATDLASAETWSSSAFNFKVVESGCCIGNRGNANDDPDDKANISDVSFLITFLFGVPSGPEPICWEEGNVNGDGEEKVNISDVTYLITYLFGIPQGPAPPPCP